MNMVYIRFRDVLESVAFPPLIAKQRRMCASSVGGSQECFRRLVIEMVGVMQELHER
jgi:hypothetical protein